MLSQTMSLMDIENIGLSWAIFHLRKLTLRISSLVRCAFCAEIVLSSRQK
jgi:hypothetical protein